jgi:hypothetical protein
VSSKKKLRDIWTEKEKACLNRLAFSRTYITELLDVSNKAMESK